MMMQAAPSIDAVAARPFDSIEELAATVAPLMQAIASALGPHCEVVLHDLAPRDLAHSIFAIVNGHVSGRAVGGPSTNLGIDALRDDAADHDDFGYRGRTADGRELRSSSVYFRDAEGLILAALCINVDLTPLQHAQAAVAALLPAPEPTEIVPEKELVGSDIGAVLDGMIEAAIAAVGKAPALMGKPDRIATLRILDQRGAFAVKRSVDQVAARLGISRVTAYNYLDEIRRPG